MTQPWQKEDDAKMRGVMCNIQLLGRYMKVYHLRS